MVNVHRVCLWKNPGYTEACLEVPPAGSAKLPTPNIDYALSTTAWLRIPGERWLNAFDLPVSWFTVKDMSYVALTFKVNNSSERIFGWIDRIEPIANQEEACRIYWHPDYWRTYSGSVTFSRGVITKTNNSSYKRPLTMNPRLWTVLDRLNLNPGKENGVTLAYVESDGNTPANTEIKFLWWKLGKANTPSLNDIYAGKIEEDLGLDPKSIIGVWLTPVSTLIGSETSYTHGSFKVGTARASGAQGSITTYFSSPVTVDSMHRIVVSDYMGAIVGEIPYGFTVYGWIARLDYGSSGCNTIIDWLSDGNGSTFAPEDGLRMQLPGYSLPVTENAWSSYNYSGQRDYDREIRLINRDQKAVQGITSAATSAVNGALTGAIIGSAGGPIGAAAGAAIGLGTSLGGTAAEYMTAQTFDDRLQAATDKLYSNQSCNMIQTAAGPIWSKFTKSYSVCVLEPDSISKAEMQAFITTQGYDVEIPAADVSSFITAGGPLQIVNLQVTGAVPPAAKEAIKTKLSAGVYIVENNSSGSDY